MLYVLALLYVKVTRHVDTRMTTTKLRKLQRLSPEELAYVAGFLDGDGSICARIVKRPEYRLQFEIRVSLSFFQKTTRH